MNKVVHLELLPIQKGLMGAMRVYTARLLVLLSVAALIFCLFISIETGLRRQFVPSLIALMLLLTTMCVMLLVARTWIGRWGDRSDMALVLIGNHLDDQGSFRDAAIHYWRALRKNPFNVVAYNNLAYSILSKDGGDYRKAFIYAQLAYFLSGRNKAASVLETVGWAYYRHLGDLDRSEKLIRLAITMTVADGSAYGLLQSLYHLMVVAYHRGNQVQAKKLYDALRSIEPVTAYDFVARNGAERIAKHWINTTDEG